MASTSAFAGEDISAEDIQALKDQISLLQMEVSALKSVQNQTMITTYVL